MIVSYRPLIIIIITSIHCQVNILLQQNVSALCPVTAMKIAKKGMQPAEEYELGAAWHLTSTPTPSSELT